MQFKDLFSSHASSYKSFRPRYPRELFTYLATLPKEKNIAWDVGTGNGQAAVELASLFNKVIATDPSAEQIKNADRQPNVEYRVSPAEHSGLERNSVDLITVAQAFHWLRHEDFFAEARAVAKPGAALAIWAYELAHISADIDRIVLELYQDVLGPYWEPERVMVENNYNTVHFPFEEMRAPAFAMSAEWSFAALAGYLNTWSALKKYEKSKGTNPLLLIEKKLEKAWGEAAARHVSWTLRPRVFRL